MGPGFLMSIAYLDPGNIAGDLEAGAKGGYHLIWTLFWATTLGLFYQSFASRIGVVTQRNLAKVCALQYSKKTRYALWLMAELAIIGADIQEVVGSATALYILLGMPLWAGALFTICDSFLFLLIHYYGVRKLEAFFVFLISVMGISFMANMFIAKPSVGSMVEGVLYPDVPEGAWPATLGLIGAVIMPHNLYLHSSLVLTRKIDSRNRNQVHESNIYNTIESAISLFISFCISTSVIATFAVYVEKHPDNRDLDLLSASLALKEAFGGYSKYIWAVGLLAAGQSSTMTGTYAGQFVMEGFLNFKLPIYQRVLITRSIAIVPALCVTFLDTTSLTNLDTWLNILQSVQLPFALIPTIKFASSRDVMGDFAVSRFQYLFATFFGTCLFTMNFVILYIENRLSTPLHYAAAGLLTIVYCTFVVFAIVEPTRPLKTITQQEIEDHEYERVEIPEDGGDSIEPGPKDSLLGTAME